MNLQELDIPRESIGLTEAVQEMSQGQWEGRNRSEIYTPALVPIINSTQPDFRAPGGESQRQVEFRMMEFLNNVVLPRASSALQKARRQRGSREHLNKIQLTSTQVDMNSILAFPPIFCSLHASWRQGHIKAGKVEKQTISVKLGKCQKSSSNNRLNSEIYL